MRVMVMALNGLLHTLYKWGNIPTLYMGNGKHNTHITQNTHNTIHA